MYFKSWIGLVVVGVALASPSVAQVYGRDINDAQDTPALRNAFTMLTAAIRDYDVSLKKVTAQNAPESLKELNAQAHNLGTTLEKAASTISGSGPLKGIQDAIGLLTPGKAIFAAMNQTFVDMSEKIDIIKNSKQTALVVDALKSQKAGFIAFQKAMDTQVPPSMKGQIPQGIALPTDEQINLVLDDLISQVGGIMDGKATSFTMPGFLPPVPTGIPGAAGGLPGAGGAGVTAGIPSAPSTPQSGSIPKSGDIPKDIPKPKGPYVEESFRA